MTEYYKTKKPLYNINRELYNDIKKSEFPDNLHGYYTDVVKRIYDFVNENTTTKTLREMFDKLGFDYKKWEWLSFSTRQLEQNVNKGCSLTYHGQIWPPPKNPIKSMTYNENETGTKKGRKKDIYCEIN